jgi:hypothetical protein
MDDNTDDLEYLAYVKSLPKDNGQANETETDIEEVFTVEEWERALNKEPVISDISEREKENEEIARPLEETLKRYCDYIAKEFGLTYQNLTHIRNFKRHKGEHVPDFLIHDIAAVELKNWACRNYKVAIKEANNQVLNKFKRYPRDFKRVLVIARPRWYNGVREYLESKGVYVIELGFVVVDENKNRAYNIIKEKLDEILYLPYIAYQPKDTWSI